MGYTREVCLRASNELERRRRVAEAEALERRRRVLAAQPAVADCERRMACSTAAIAHAVLNGENVDSVLSHAQEENQKARDELAALIAAAGETGSDFSPVYTCPLCRDTGHSGTQICSCHRALLAKYASEELSKQTGLKLLSFDDIDLTYYDEDVRTRMQDIFSFCRAYGEHFDTHADSLLLSGSTGTGKTHAALSIARLATEKGYSVVYGPAPTLMRKLEREHFNREEGHTEETLLSCDLLILDDLGTEMTTSFTAASLYDILNGRILRGLPTIISTNLTASDWAPRYGEAIASRVLGTYEPLAFIGNDVRQAKLERRLSGEY